ncbi:head maturation protease, ClpP-related [Umezawaea tangerina]|uniref:ATP-dependent Clp protease proteolytic subunit n=1 Tax=Umezawaea tangerina TaxID=84725 RepID=A0A2T0SPL5_9PSEU|nr:head maturation protease, ClpP-related [Umezawaea tangerina]PRY35350.1 ATP-dependent protease ClpP protease subunit [Umezawaea tangerina]
MKDHTPAGPVPESNTAALAVFAMPTASSVQWIYAGMANACGRRRVFNSATSTKERLRTARPRVQLREGRQDWYRIENLANESTAVIRIYNEIGYWGITAQDFVRELEQVTASRIELHLNSPGGDAFDGIAIYNALRQHSAEVHVTVDALAASIASVIAMSGDTVTMATGSTMMIHDASGIEIGNAEDFRKYADLLDTVSDSVAAIYADRAGGTTEQWRAMMRAETWYTAEEAVAAGLANAVAATQERPSPVPQNTWDLSVFTYAGRTAAPPPPAIARPSNSTADTGLTPTVPEASATETTDPAVAEPAVAEPAVAEPAVTEPALTEPAAVEPVAPAPVEAAPEDTTEASTTPVAPTVSSVQQEAAGTADATAAEVAPEPAADAPPVVDEVDPTPAESDSATDSWAALTNGFHNSAPSTQDAVSFDALKEGFLRC